MDCPKCDENEYDLHTCPFRVEIDDDEETLCNCCEECTQDCADNI